MFRRFNQPKKGKAQMLRSLTTAVSAASLALGILAFSGPLQSANAEPVNSPAAKTYADVTTPGGNRASLLAKSGQAMPQVNSAWQSAPEPNPPYACSLECRTGFFGYN
jgi:hypothetical protein